MSDKSEPLTDADLGAIEARAIEAQEANVARPIAGDEIPSGARLAAVWDSAQDAPRLLAEVRRLRHVDPDAIQVAVNVTLDSRALARVNALHGCPDGAPLDQPATRAHVDATHAVLRSRVATLLASVDVDGGVTFRARP